MSKEVDRSVMLPRDNTEGAGSAFLTETDAIALTVAEDGVRHPRGEHNVEMLQLRQDLEDWTARLREAQSNSAKVSVQQKQREANLLKRQRELKAGMARYKSHVEGIDKRRRDAERQRKDMEESEATENAKIQAVRYQLAALTALRDIQNNNLEDMATFPAFLSSYISGSVAAEATPLGMDAASVDSFSTEVEGVMARYQALSSQCATLSSEVAAKEAERERLVRESREASLQGERDVAEVQARVAAVRERIEAQDRGAAQGRGGEPAKGGDPKAPSADTVEREIRTISELEIAINHLYGRSRPSRNVQATVQNAELAELLAGGLPRSLVLLREKKAQTAGVPVSEIPVTDCVSERIRSLLVKLACLAEGVVDSEIIAEQLAAAHPDLEDSDPLSPDPEKGSGRSSSLTAMFPSSRSASASGLVAGQPRVRRAPVPLRPRRGLDMGPTSHPATLPPIHNPRTHRGGRGE
ncbi:hypothetical protein KIPB_000729 [Kipferlia bialata]|uniref:DUF4200 domain-containing protein n=1 Tax=Kipferlia bialata TaxID=797122 RepID=A0A9K3GDN5_9EUKA|nr:hypothetical protein KIPB_000729 [Kipferlia bialata]|eukprot:g729.t1